MPITTMTTAPARVRSPNVRIASTAIVESEPHVPQPISMINMVSKDQDYAGRISANQKEIMFVLEFPPPQVGKDEDREDKQREE